MKSYNLLISSVACLRIVASGQRGVPSGLPWSPCQLNSLIVKKKWGLVRNIVTSLVQAYQFSSKFFVRPVIVCLSLSFS